MRDEMIDLEPDPDPERFLACGKSATAERTATRRQARDCLEERSPKGVRSRSRLENGKTPEDTASSKEEWPPEVPKAMRPRSIQMASGCRLEKKPKSTPRWLRWLIRQSAG